MSDEVKVEKVDPTVLLPRYGTLAWNDYVKSQFAEDELFEGNPKVDGLMRLTEELLGFVTDYNIAVTESPGPKNDYASTVCCTMMIKLHENGPLGEVKYLKTSGSGDCSVFNADRVYGKFPTSLAETRAKARALRFALRLRNTVAAEELLVDVPDESDEYRTDAQVDSINILCEKMNINVVRLITSVAKDKSYSITTMAKLHKHIASKCIKLLNSYQDDKTKIPESLMGYKKGWMTPSK